MTNKTLIDQLLTEQRSLTAVERFAQKHERGEVPAQSRYYEDLIPLSKPAKGQQYAFAVNLDQCTGCKACVSACHSLNGLEEHETWRDVGLLVGGNHGTSYQQTITTACHHCADPACLEGCPVVAYDKDEETGIVRHLDDQCIGCQYCTMKCPYEVPKYSKRLGIVRKCDMCHDRLAVGEAPACVQACPHEAIQIRIVDLSEIRALTTPGTQLLPGTFDSSYTHPTTSYTTTKKMPSDTRSATAEAVHLEHAHWPLIFMLVLTQMAVGLSLALAGLSFYPEALAVTGLALAVSSFTILNVGLIAALFHLGRPLGAWRFFLGLRTSWMSREILAFSIFAGAASAAILPAFLVNPLAVQIVPVEWLGVIQPWLGLSAKALTGGAAFLGMIAVFTSAMIYVDTHRPLWHASLTLPRFFGATLTLGAGATAVILGIFLPEAAPFASWICLACLAVTFGWEMSRFSDSLNDSDDPNHRSALTLDQLLPRLISLRGVLFIATAICLIAAAAAIMPLATSPVALGLLLIAQTLERFAFFATVIAPRMPRGI